MVAERLPISNSARYKKMLLILCSFLYDHDVPIAGCSPFGLIAEKSMSGLVQTNVEEQPDSRKTILADASPSG